MEALNNNSQNTHIYELINAQIADLDIRELMLIYEMIQLIKQPKSAKMQKKGTNGFPFLQVQEALKGVTGNLSDDIINIEREERI